MLTATETETKTCRCCFEAQPVTEFRRKRKNSEDRHGQCRLCFNREMSERRKAMRRRKVCTYVREVQAVKRDRDRVIVLTEELTRGLGGMETIVALFKEVYEEALAANRSFTAFRVLKTVLDLSIVADELRREQLTSLSDEEFEEVRRRAIRDEISENPALAIVAAHELGWMIIPPDEDKDVDA
ncbi:MAG TPA: hypothetical protein QF564_29640 [Pirellulaceae bacterium]|nr:hypothetical protein [Pirellulaceae bacterium]